MDFKDTFATQFMYSYDSIFFICMKFNLYNFKVICLVVYL